MTRAARPGDPHEPRLFEPADQPHLPLDADPPVGVVASGPTVRVRLTVAYDGGAFRGFAANAGVATVAGALEDALGRVLRHPVTLACAGRTDAGVHARGQVVSFDAPADGLDLARVVQATNRMCAPTVVVREAAVVADTFDARHSALARRYRYQIQAGGPPDPLRRHETWWVPDALDLSLLRLGCDPLIGEHDFASFCRRARLAPGPDGEVRHAPTVRRVRDARWERGPDDLLWFWIEADAFCHQMVRSIVGTLVEVGAGRMRPGELRGVLAARDRHAAGPMAPAHGLCLWSVRYPDDG